MWRQGTAPREPAMNYATVYCHGIIFSAVPLWAIGTFHGPGVYVFSRQERDGSRSALYIGEAASIAGRARPSHLDGRGCCTRHGRGVRALACPDTVGAPGRRRLLAPALPDAPQPTAAHSAGPWFAQRADAMSAMPRYRFVPWKRNVRKPPREVTEWLKANPSTQPVVGCIKTIPTISTGRPARTPIWDWVMSAVARSSQIMRAIGRTRSLLDQEPRGLGGQARRSAHDHQDRQFRRAELGRPIKGISYC